MFMMFVIGVFCGGLFACLLFMLFGALERRQIRRARQRHGLR